MARDVATLAVVLFSILTAYYLIKPVRDSLLVHYAGIENLPIALILQGIWALATVFAINALSSYLPRRVFATTTFSYFALSGAGFAIAISAGYVPVWMAVAFYIWTTVFIVAALSVSWSIAAHINLPEEGKRSYLLIAFAAPVGGVSGSAISSLGVTHIGLSGSIWFACIILLGVTFLAPTLVSKNTGGLETNASTLVVGFRGVTQTLREVAIRNIAIVVVLGSVVWALLDRQIYFIVESRNYTELETGKFFGDAYFTINWFTLLVQASLLFWLRKGFNPAIGILVLPGLTLIGASIVFLARGEHIYWILLWVSFAVTSYSVNHTSREMLYLYVGEDNKFRAKPVVDVVVQRGGEMLGGIFLYIAYAPEAGNLFAILIALFCVIWLFACTRIRRILKLS